MMPKFRFAVHALLLIFCLTSMFYIVYMYHLGNIKLVSSFIHIVLLACTAEDCNAELTKIKKENQS